MIPPVNIVPSLLPPPPPGSYSTPQSPLAPSDNQSPLSLKWVGAWIGVWIILAGIAEIPAAEELAAVLALTVAFSTSVMLGPQAVSNLQGKLK